MAPRQDVRELLASIKTRGTFATRRTSAADDLCLEVNGVGRITWPVKNTMARRLCAIARPARYGLKTETRFDPRVRDTPALRPRCTTCSCMGRASSSPATAIPRRPTT